MNSFSSLVYLYGVLALKFEAVFNFNSFLDTICSYDYFSLSLSTYLVLSLDITYN